MPVLSGPDLVQLSGRDLAGAFLLDLFHKGQNLMDALTGLGRDEEDRHVREEA